MLGAASAQKKNFCSEQSKVRRATRCGSKITYSQQKIGGAHFFAAQRIFWRKNFLWCKFFREELECPGMSWNVLECHGIPWNTMECHGIHGMSLNPLECHGMSWNMSEYY